MVKNTRSERGQDLVELAITLPLFIFLIAACIDLGRSIFYYTAVLNGAREGARHAAVDQTSAGIIAAVERLMVGLNPDNTAVSVKYCYYDKTTDTYVCTCSSIGQSTDCQKSSKVVVEVTYRFAVITPLMDVFVPLNPVTLRASSTMFLER